MNLEDICVGMEITYASHILNPDGAVVTDGKVAFGVVRFIEPDRSFFHVGNALGEFRVARALVIGRRIESLDFAHECSLNPAQLRTIVQSVDNELRTGQRCPRDTDGDGDCGNRHCPICGNPAARRGNAPTPPLS